MKLIPAIREVHDFWVYYDLHLIGVKLDRRLTVAFSRGRFYVQNVMDPLLGGT